MKLIICEGQDDQSVIEGLLSHAGIAGIRIESCGGVPKFNDYLRGLPKRGDFVRREVEALGIVLDADQSRATCWQRIQDRVREAFGVELKAECEWEGNRPRIGAFIAGAGTAGTLEDLALEAAGGQNGFRCLDAYFRCLSDETGQTRYSGKARFRAWMASQSDHDLRLGKAATGGYIPWDSNAFDSLRQFLVGL